MSNESFDYPGGWDSISTWQNDILLVVCILAAIFHGNLWLQLFLRKTKFDLSFVFSLGYIATDSFLILFYFIQYSIRSRAWIPITRPMCYLEAYGMFYINIVESYCLTILNMCRYYQISRNENIYVRHRRKVIFVSIIAPILILLNLIIQHVSGLCVLAIQTGSSCSLTYTNNIVRVWNLGVVLIAPIAISFYMLGRALHTLRSVHARQALVRRNFHRQLIINSSIFYSIWIILWLPAMIVNYLGINDKYKSITFAVTLASVLEILSDAVISIFLDKRFSQAWKKFYRVVEHQVGERLTTKANAVTPVAVIQPNNTLTRTHT